MYSSSVDSAESESDSDNSFCTNITVLDEYQGFRPATGISHVTERVSSDIKPADFFQKYVKTRRPAVFNGLLNDSLWNNKHWTNSFLAQHAGHVNVLVEDRMAANRQVSFGISSPKVEMKYSDFITALVTGETRYYHTTQDLERFVNEYDECGLPKCISAEPVRTLKDNYPVQPAVLGNLVPHQISLWQGFTGKGSSTSSGLHHDFHDNLYLLIRGRKRFRLFPPSAANLLRVSGNVVKIHENGLIVYAPTHTSNCRVPVRADGAPLTIIARHRHQEAERRLEEAESKLITLQSCDSIDNDEVKAQIKTAQDLVAICEQELDAALEELLRYSDGSSDSEVESNDTDDEPVTKRKKHQISNSDPQHNKLDHFCNVELPAEDCNDWQTMFAQFEQPDKIACLVVTLEAGEMLYLPASWFHEVTSYDNSESETDPDLAGHLAVNYWMYPPDGDSFDQPYKDNFWSERWSRLCKDKSSGSENWCVSATTVQCAAKM